MEKPLLTPNEVEVECLSDERKSFFLGVTPVSVATFFTGSVDAAEAHLRTKLLSVLHLNPWLLGTLVRKSKDLLVIRYSPTLPATFALVDPLFSVITDPSLNEDLAFEKLTEKAMPLLADTGDKLLQKGSAGVPIRLTLVRIASSRFAVVFSISHSFVDGHNFYDLYAMLSQPLPGTTGSKGTSVDRSVPRALQCPRVGAYDKERDAATGGNDGLTWLFTPGGIMTIIRSLFFSGRLTLTVLPVNIRVIERMKKESLALEGSGGRDASPWPVPFVSTNDVLTSELGRAFKADAFIAAMDMRGKAPCLHNDSVGNYSTGLSYMPEDLRSPGRVRRALCRPDGRIRRVHGDRPFPGFWRSFSFRTAGITNWSTFYTDLLLPEAEQVKHCPVVDVRTYPMQGGAVVFAPKAGQMSVLVMSRSARIRDDVCSLEIFS